MSTSQLNFGDQPFPTAATSNKYQGLDWPPLEPIIALGILNSPGASDYAPDNNAYPANAIRVILAAENAAHGCCDESAEDSERWDGMS